MAHLKNRTAIVTGASRGLGKTIAKLLAQNGANVIINYATNLQQANEVVSEITRSGGQAYAIQADISKPSAIASLFDQTIDKYGKIDIVINNAGIMIIKPTRDTTEEDFDKTFSVNTKSVFFSMKEASTAMDES